MPVNSLDLAEMANIRVPHGNTRTVLFKLRRKSTTSALDVSAATKIWLEWVKNGVVQSPIAAQSNGVLADWANGAVPLILTRATILADIGIYPYSLTVFYTDDNPETLAVGTVEVYARPGFPLP